MQFAGYAFLQMIVIAGLAGGMVAAVVIVTFTWLFSPSPWKRGVAFIYAAALIWSPVETLGWTGVVLLYSPLLFLMWVERKIAR